VTLQEKPNIFPKGTKENGIMIRDNVGGETKIIPYMGEKEICSLRRNNSLRARDKKFHFG
jgi:hypothetical protein